MLECEILARCIKHHFAALFRAHPEIRSYPAQTIASLFNYIFGSNEKPEESPEAIAAELVADSGAKGGSKKKKGKSHKSVPGASEESTVPSLPDVTASREETLAAIKKEAAARFCYSTFHTVNFKTVQQIEDDLAATLATLNFDTPDSPKDSGNDKKKDKKKNKKEDEDDPKARTIAAISKVFRDSAKKVLSGRLSAIPLLRRVCLVTGVRVATRRYDFSSATPFTAGDIIAVNPLVSMSICYLFVWFSALISNTNGRTTIPISFDGLSIDRSRVASRLSPSQRQENSSTAPAASCPKATSLPPSSFSKRPPTGSDRYTLIYIVL
jgi:hypothetical protein